MCINYNTFPDAVCPSFLPFIVSRLSSEATFSLPFSVAVAISFLRVEIKLS